MNYVDEILEGLLENATPAQTEILEKLQYHLKTEYNTSFTMFIQTELPYTAPLDFWENIMEQPDPIQAFDDIYAEAVYSTAKRKWRPIKDKPGNTKADA